jgi:hypothetical protein
MSKLTKYKNKKQKQKGGNITNCDSTVFYSEISDKPVIQLPGLNYDHTFQENLTTYIQELYKTTLVNQPNTFEQDKPYLMPFLTYIRSFNKNYGSKDANKLFTLLYLFGRELDVNNIYLNDNLEIGKNSFKQICGEISENGRLQCAVQIVLPTIFKKIYAIYSKIPDFSGKFKMFFLFYQDTVANNTLNNNQKRDDIQDFLNNPDYKIIKEFNTNLIYLLVTLQTSGEKILEYINIHFIQQENMKAVDSGLDTVLTYLIGNSYDNPPPNSTKEQVFKYITNNFTEIDNLFGESISKSIFESNIFIGCDFDKVNLKVNFSVEKKSSFILSLNNGSNYSQPLAILYLQEKYDFTNDVYEQTEKLRWILDNQSLQNIILCSNDAFSFLKCIQPVNEIKGLNLSSCNKQSPIITNNGVNIDSSSNYSLSGIADKASQVAVKAKDITLKNPEAVGIGATMAAVGSALGTLAYYGLIFGGANNKTRQNNKKGGKKTRKRRIEDY